MQAVAAFVCLLRRSNLVVGGILDSPSTLVAHHHLGPWLEARPVAALSLSPGPPAMGPVRLCCMEARRGAPPPTPPNPHHTPLKFCQLASELPAARVPLIATVPPPPHTSRDQCVRLPHSTSRDAGVGACGSHSLPTQPLRPRPPPPPPAPRPHPCIPCRPPIHPRIPCRHPPCHPTGRHGPQVYQVAWLCTWAIHG